MKRFLEWLDGYDDLIVSIFKFLLIIGVVIIGAHLDRENKKAITKEAIKELNINK